jgi:hypothetical protein
MVHLPAITIASGTITIVGLAIGIRLSVKVPVMRALSNHLTKQYID